ncbi:MAG: hypothetical protein LBJ42_02550 [Holosporales bacterium]|jgi:hypothetical protein|nr:hypothetical protein [Holosporales bacterium]
MRFDINRNVRKKQGHNSRRRYLQYDDVFMSANRQYDQRIEQSHEQDPEPFRETTRQQPRPEHKEIAYEYDHDYEEDQRRESELPERRKYFHRADSNIINEKMVRYHKRQLPPLQRYAPDRNRDMYAEFSRSYWDEDYDHRGAGRSQRYAVRDLWRKFVVTFSSILSLVCLSWIAYNWNSDRGGGRTNGEPPLVEPSQPSFKALPDNPGGEIIPHKEKEVYSRVSKMQPPDDEILLPPQEQEGALPRGDRQIPSEGNYREPVEAYSIVDDRIYYIKISAGKGRSILENEAILLRKKFPTLFTGKNCSVKKVSNSSGEQKDAIRIGPFASQNSALEIAKELGTPCYVISVKD